MKYLLIIILLPLFSAVFGAKVGEMLVTIIPAAPIIGAGFGWMAGGMTGILLVEYIKKSKRTKSVATPSPAPLQLSRPFQSRLADFAQRDSRDVMGEHEPFESKMPFWTAVQALFLSPPKTAAQIRQALLSIRQTLRR